MYEDEAAQRASLAPRLDDRDGDIELASLATSDNDGSGSPNSRDSFSPRDSLSSQDPFDFADPADDPDGVLPSIPLSRPPPARRRRTTGRSAATRQDETGAVKTIRFRNGLGLCIGLQIGSGIFSSPGLVAAVGSPGAALLVWAVAGGLAWMGAASYAELGAAIPLNGGTHAYLRVAYGDVAAFLFSWTAIICLKPGSAAIIATVTAEYIIAAVTGQRAADTHGWRKLIVDMVAILCLAFASALVAIGSALATRVNDVFTVIKIGALLAVFGLGLAQSALGLGLSTLWTAPFSGTSLSAGVWAVSLLGALWPYDGWDNCSYVAAEMVDPKRDIPRVVHTAQPVVTAAYVLANAAYFAVLPLAQVSETHAVGLEFGRAVLGRPGALGLAVAVVCSSLGALLSTTFTTARLVAASAASGEIPAVLGANHARLKTPANAVLLQLALASAYVLAGNFERLVTFYGVAAWCFYLATSLAVLLLRRTQPELERPYRVPLAFPVVFAIVALWLVLATTTEHPVEAGAGFAFLLLGIPAYCVRFGTGAAGRALRRWYDVAARRLGVRSGGVEVDRPQTRMQRAAVI